MLLMELVNEAGFPPGTVNVVHGQHEGLSALHVSLIWMQILTTRDHSFLWQILWASLPNSTAYFSRFSTYSKSIYSSEAQ